MDSLKEGIGLRGYGQRDPLVEYKREAYAMFEDLIQRIKEEVSELIFKVQISKEPSFKKVPSKPALVGARENSSSSRKTSKKKKKKTKIGRNDPCPCGSGKKYKYCCGRGK